jgi:hypothetical protein
MILTFVYQNYPHTSQTQNHLFYIHFNLLKYLLALDHDVLFFTSLTHKTHSIIASLSKMLIII